jgi:hypothetical protein
VPVRLLHVELDERARQFLIFPRRRRFARAQAHDHVLPPNRLAGMKRDVLDDPVALVEDAEHRDALRHRRDAALPCGVRRAPAGDGRRGVLLLRGLAARGERQRKEQRCSDYPHAYSGIQGS